MKTYNYKVLSPSDINTLCERNKLSDVAVIDVVKNIVKTVKELGDKALFSFSEQFDKVALDKLYADKHEIAKQALKLTDTQRNAIDMAYANIELFHKAQQIKEAVIETTSGVRCWREARPIEIVGLYIPGGNAILPSTLLMLGIPAKIAGCKEVVVCCPPQKDGTVNPYVAYVVTKLGLGKVFLIGGAQAVAAMAYGTASVPKVSKVFGPGNRYVTIAKTILQGEGQIAIDMPAGPSEVLVIADDNANAAFVASDLLSQAEHGADSQAILVSNSERVINAVKEELQKQLVVLPRSEFAQKALDGSYIVQVNTLEEAISFSNQYAPEHLILNVVNFDALIPLVSNAGSVFLGQYTPESAGDYASGTNHTLPTSGCARTYSGVSLDSFIKKITFQQISKGGIKNLGPTIATLADIEGLQAHKNAVTIRINS